MLQPSLSSCGLMNGFTSRARAERSGWRILATPAGRRDGYTMPSAGLRSSIGHDDARCDKHVYSSNAARSPYMCCVAPGQQKRTTGSTSHERHALMRCPSQVPNRARACWRYRSRHSGCRARSLVVGAELGGGRAGKETLWGRRHAMQVGRGAWRRSELVGRLEAREHCDGTSSSAERCGGRWAAGRLRWGQDTVCGHESRLFRRLEARVRHVRLPGAGLGHSVIVQHQGGGPAAASRSHRCALTRSGPEGRTDRTAG
jgi:hypothetical protein